MLAQLSGLSFWNKNPSQLNLFGAIQKDKRKDMLVDCEIIGHGIEHTKEYWETNENKWPTRLAHRAILGDKLKEMLAGLQESSGRQSSTYSK